MSWIYRIGYKNDTETCSKCGSKLIPIIYGFPNEILMEQYKAGEVELGGCVISSDDNNMHCPNCKTVSDSNHLMLMLPVHYIHTFTQYSMM